MNNVFVNIKNENELIRSYFTTDFITIDQLLNLVEDLSNEIDILKERIEDINTKDEPDEYDIWHDNIMLEE